MSGFKDSKILEGFSKANDLVRLCEFDKDQKWTLLYQGSKDGFTADALSERCNAIGNTLIIVKTDTGDIFGGYADRAWSASDEWEEDPNAFIFSFANKDNTQYRLVCDDLVVQCGQSCLLLFGGKHNFWIGAHANLTDNSYTYFNPTGPAEYDMLKIADIEVYTKRADDTKEIATDKSRELEPISETDKDSDVADAEQHSITVEETSIDEYRKKLSKLEIKCQSTSSSNCAVAATKKVEKALVEDEGTMRFLKKIPQL